MLPRLAALLAGSRAGVGGALERTGVTAGDDVLTAADVLAGVGVRAGAAALAVTEADRPEAALWVLRGWVEAAWERLTVLRGSLRPGIAGTAAIPETASRLALTPGARG